MKKMKTILCALSALVLVLASGCKDKVNDHVVDYTVDVPESFQEGELDGITACWTAADGSNINLNVTDKGKDFDKIDADMLRDALIEAFSSYGAADITDRYFTGDPVCGLPAYQYCYDIQLGDLKMIQLVVCVNADKTYTFTYTDTTGSWIGQFEESAKNIQLVIE